ncbi:hypothetical protein H0H92_011184 [Tricholoma furcatifolium]|nr:hypothetical protein H0H92_011184 [Tricholoma furcatifolium]
MSTDNPSLSPIYTDDAQVQHFAEAMNDPCNDPQSVFYQRPSEIWLDRPASIDGAVNPPRFYYCNEDMDAALIAAGRPALSRKILDQSYSRISPTPMVATHDATRLSPDTPPSEVEATVISSQPIHYPNTIPNIEVTYLISVTMLFTPITTTVTHGKNVKKEKKTKMIHIKMEGISRVEFIKLFLAVFDLATHFSPGVHAGPDFKFWFTGITKTAAATIQNDTDFNVVLNALAK